MSDGGRNKRTLKPVKWGKRLSTRFDGSTDWLWEAGCGGKQVRWRKCAWYLLCKDGETLGSTQSSWWGIKKGDLGNVDVKVNLSISILAQGEQWRCRDEKLVILSRQQVERWIAENLQYLWMEKSERNSWDRQSSSKIAVSPLCVCISSREGFFSPEYLIFFFFFSGWRGVCEFRLERW